MMKSKGQKWSERSQSSLLKQFRLESSLKKCQQQIGRDAAAVEMRDSESSQLASSRQTLGPIVNERLMKKLTGLEAAKRMLAFSQSDRARLEREIHAISHPPASETRARRKGQRILASFVADRWAEDRSIGAAVEKPRERSKKRRELTAKMLDAARTIDLTVEIDSFDTARFDDLLNSLPEG
jgi:hypothetical protein